MLGGQGYGVFLGFDEHYWQMAYREVAPPKNEWLVAQWIVFHNYRANGIDKKIEDCIPQFNIEEARQAQEEARERRIKQEQYMIEMKIRAAERRQRKVAANAK